MRTLSPTTDGAADRSKRRRPRFRLYPQHRSLLAKTLLIVAGATCLTSAMIVIAAILITYRQFESNAKDNLDETIEAMRSMASIACYAKDAMLAKETAQAIIKNSNVLQVSITAYGKVLGSAARAGSGPLFTEASDRVIERSLSSPFDSDEIIGKVSLMPNWPEINRRVLQSVESNATMMLFMAIAIISVVGFVITFFIVHPVQMISNQLHRLNTHEDDVLKMPEGHEANELGRLVADINDLLGRLRSSLAREHELHLQQVIHEKLRLPAAVFEHSHEGITITDAENNIVAVNRAFTQITGYSETDVLGRNPSVLASGRHGKEFYARMWRSLTTLGYWKGEVWNRCKNGEIKPKWFSISVIRDGTGKVENYLAIFSDITDRKRAEERIEFLAHHDALTQLPNRVLTRDRFEQAVASAARDNAGVALLYIDLDNFKYVNDTFGHQAGDHLLLTVVERLKKHMRDSDTISRQGGDEFLLILGHIRDKDVVERVCRQLLGNIASPFDIEGHLVGISACIGVAMYPEDGTDFGTLLKNADAAMYAAKTGGKNAYRFYVEEMNLDALDKLRLKAHLRNAITNGGFRLAYQAQIDIASGNIVGAEALVRWHRSDEHDIITPDRFIALAEESGLIGDIGNWVIEEACRQATRWFTADIPPLVISVNVSSLQFNGEAIVASVRNALLRTGMPSSWLGLEFTETVLLSDIRHSVAIIEKLKSLGVSLSIDDFGTGYSSLSYLQQLKVDKLKIDQSFVRNIGSTPEGSGIIEAIVHLGQALKLTVIAEGVETAQQLATLKALGCDEAQGYLISRPLEAEAFEQFLRERPRRKLQ